MEDIEVPTEHLQEHIQEKAEENRESWSLYLVLSTAFMAVLAAISGLMGGHHANEAVLEQIKASDNWSQYQAKSIKSEIHSSIDKLTVKLTGKDIPPDDITKLEGYEKDKEAIKKQAEANERSSEEHLRKHNTLARSVTLFQIAIAIAAIAIITKRKPLWLFSMALTIAGGIFLIEGIFF